MLSQQVGRTKDPLVSKLAPLHPAHLFNEGKLALGPGLALQHIPHLLQFEHRIPIPKINNKILNLLQTVQNPHNHSHYLVLEILHPVEVDLLAEVAVD